MLSHRVKLGVCINRNTFSPSWWQQVIHFTEYRTCVNHEHCHCWQQHCSATWKPTSWRKLCYRLYSRTMASRKSQPSQFGGKGVTKQRQREKRGSATECWVYTPNNRCRPEAPLTSLPKLTPVKNVEEDRRDGEGEEEEKGRTTQDKNHKRQKQRDGGQSRDTAKWCVFKSSCRVQQPQKMSKHKPNW